jgi:hypothetical protein
MTVYIVENNHFTSLRQSISPSLVIVDSGVEDLQTLLQSLDSSDHDVLVLDNNADGVEQITNGLMSRDVLPEVIHLVAHGAPGTLYLGNSQLALANLEYHAHALQKWAVKELNIYACNVAAGDAGEEFLHKLHNLTQANLAASSRKVGNTLLGGSWQLGYQIGTCQSPKFATPQLEISYAGVLNNQFTRIYTVTEDNSDNAGTFGNPDGDFGRGIRVGANFAVDASTGERLDGVEPPIEFYIPTDIDATVGSAFLFVSIFDVDAPAEKDLVTFNGTELGLLEGENELTFRTIFEVPNSLVLNGNNFVEIDIDLDNVGGPNSNRWEAEIESSTLLVNYIIGETAPGGFAFLDTIATDRDVYQGGETVQFTADIDTTKEPDQTLEIETILRDPNGAAVDFDDRSSSEQFSITGLDDTDAFNWVPVLPDDALPGIWTIDMTVFDAQTDQFQLIGRDTFTVDTGGGGTGGGGTGGGGTGGGGTGGGGTGGGDGGVVGPGLPPVPSGPLVFQFTDFVTFEALDDNLPYRGPQGFFNGGTPPGERFFSDERLYLLANSDVATAVAQGELASGFEHYQLFGQSEGRNLLPLDVEVNGLRLAQLFDETYYLGENPDVASVVGIENGLSYGFEHFLKYGILETRNPSLFFDTEFYLSNNPDVAAAVADPNDAFRSGFQHYLLFGHLENRNPSSLFNANDYLTNNPDVEAAVNANDFDSAFDHFIEFGASEGRINILLYEEDYYLTTNGDVAAAVLGGDFPSGFEHYILFGQGEGRDPGPLFDESEYLGVNNDVDAVSDLTSGMEHYFRFGRQEGRTAWEVPTAVVV